MKNEQKDDICGKECADYVGEFSPHRLFITRLEEDSESIFEADEEKTALQK